MKTYLVCFKKNTPASIMFFKFWCTYEPCLLLKQNKKVCKSEDRLLFVWIKYQKLIPSEINSFRKGMHVVLSGLQVLFASIFDSMCKFIT